MLWSSSTSWACWTSAWKFVHSAPSLVVNLYAVRSDLNTSCISCSGVGPSSCSEGPSSDSSDSEDSSCSEESSVIRWWASRLCMLRIRGFYLLINVAVSSTAFQQTNDCIPTDPTFILWQPLLTCFVIHSILPRIIIAILHHGKVPLIDHHPNTESSHHSEATGWHAHRSLNEMTWLTWVPSQLWQLQTVSTKAVTVPRPRIIVTPCVLISTTTIT